MKIVISPAKTLDFEKKYPSTISTMPLFTKDAENLILQLRKLSIKDIANLMDISDKLAELNYRRFADWHLPFTAENSKQAIFAFRGDVYEGFDADTLTPTELARTQSNLRILSGLYGLLKPMDLIQPYRLEMGSKFENNKGKNLYEYWGVRISKQLDKEMQENGDKILLNLASNEYFKAIQPQKIKAKIITAHFKEEKNGKYSIVSFYAKKARGLMSRFIIQNEIDKIEDIKAFDLENYTINESLSDESNYVFTR